MYLVSKYCSLPKTIIFELSEVFKYIHFYKNQRKSLLILNFKWRFIKWYQPLFNEYLLDTIFPWYFVHKAILFHTDKENNFLQTFRYIDWIFINVYRIAKKKQQEILVSRPFIWYIFNFIYICHDTNKIFVFYAWFFLDATSLKNIPLSPKEELLNHILYAKLKKKGYRMSLDYPETNKLLILALKTPSREIKCQRVSEFVKHFNIPFSQIFANQKDLVWICTSCILILLLHYYIINLAIFRIITLNWRKD